MRVVVDTNTLASGSLGKSASPVTAVVDAWRSGAFVLVASSDILDELSRTFAKPYFAEHLTPSDIAAFFDLLHTIAELVTIAGALAGIATHPEDDRILEAATTAGADYLVTGDSKLQELKQFQSVTIVSARQFVTLLEGRGVDPA